jgi:hypothetical protein
MSSPFGSALFLCISEKNARWTSEGGSIRCSSRLFYISAEYIVSKGGMKYGETIA